MSAAPARTESKIPDVVLRADFGARRPASRGGEFEALLAVLDPDVVFRADAVAERAGAPTEKHGAAVVAEAFVGRARGAQLALINGVPGLAWAPGGKPHGVFRFTMKRGKIVGIDLIGDAELIRLLDVTLLED